MGSDLVTVSGLIDLQKMLDTLPAKIEANVMRGGLRAGQKEFLAAAQENVPFQSGDLRNSLRIKTSKRKGKVTATLTAGDKKAYYAHMVEFGTAQHFIKPKRRKSLFIAGIFRDIVDHPGSTPKPFMRPAFDVAQDRSIAAMAAYIRKRLNKELLKQSAEKDG